MATTRATKTADAGKMAAIFDRTPAGSIRVLFRGEMGSRERSREGSAKIYEVAAALERYCAREKLSWAISPYAFRWELVVELSDEDTEDNAVEADTEVRRIVGAVL